MNLKWLSMWLCVVWISACTFPDDKSYSAQNTCSDNTDCPGSSCDMETGVCLAADVQPVNIALQITPPNSALSGNTLVAFSSVINLQDASSESLLGASLLQNISIGKSVSVFGTVRGTLGEDANYRVNATLNFVRQGPFTGLEAKAQIQTLENPLPTEVGMEADFSLALLPGTYQVEVLPGAEDQNTFAPMRFDIDVTETGLTPLAIMYPDPQSGCVFEGVLRDPEDAGLGNLSVRAIDPKTNKVLSTVSLSDASVMNTGEFELYFLDAPDDYVLQVSAGEEAAYPTLTLVPGEDFEVSEVCDGLKTLHLPAVPEVMHYTGNVRSSIDVVSDGAVTFSSVELQSGGVWLATVMGAEDGNFEVDLLPGSYQVTITSSGQDDGLGVYVGAVEISSTGVHSPPDGAVFELPDQINYRGLLMTDQGQGVQAATIQAVALRTSSPLGGSPAELYNRSRQTQSDAEGLFDIDLDVGSYDMIIQNATDTGYPWIVRSGVRILPDHDQASITTYQYITPVVLVGTVYSGEGTGVSGAEVLAYGSVDPDSNVSRAVSLGRATTNEEGLFMLLLPPSF